MRPSLSEVKRWFTAESVRDTTVGAYLAILVADPNWRVQDRDEGAARTLRLLYFPDGVPFEVVLHRTAQGWRPRIG